MAPRVTVIRRRKRARFLDLDVDRVLEARRKQIVMVGGGRAAGKQKFDQRHAHREAQLVGLYPSPNRIERDEPGDQIRLQAGRDAREQAFDRNDDAY